MKQLFFILIAFIVFKINAQNETTNINFEVPQSFFNEMFRGPSDKYLVAWTGGVSTIVKNKNGQEIQINGVINIVEDYLNTELTNLDRRYFKFNLNSPSKRITTPNGKTWAGRCGYNPYEGITYKDIMNGVIAGWPPELTTKVWALHASKITSKKGTYINPKSGKTEVISVYFNANSTFYYHKIKPQSLKGKITRDDDYKACGEIRMYRLGPGYPRFNKKTDVIADKFEFNKELFLGEYQVQYLWEDGTFEVLEQNYIYDPFSVLPDDLEYELKTFEGEISGTLVDKETHKPIKNQKVKLQPVCSESTLPEKETITDGEGKFKFSEVPKGVYNVVTKGASNTLAGLTKGPALRLREIEVKPNYKYDIYATYTASGFAKAELVWRAATIKFPEEGDKIQFFDMIAFKNSGDYDNPTGTDGEPLKIPYTTIIPGIGKQTLYGWPESETATPEVLSVSSLGGYKVFPRFKVSLDEDALNSCNISQDNNGPIYLELNFDLSGRYPNSTVWQQVDVGTREDKVWNATKGNSANGYPQSFKRYYFTKAEIEKFKNGELLEINLTGKANLKVEFKPLENQ